VPSARDPDAAADGKVRVAPARTVLWAGLALLWTVDGLLELQPHMALDELDIVLMGGWGQPNWYINWLSNHFIAWIYQDHWAAALDGLVLGIQVALGLAIWVGRETRWGRLAVYVSLLWAAAVWAVAEWMGGLFGGMTFFTGGPGAVVLYAYGGLLLLVPARRYEDPLFARRLRQALGAWWGLGALLQVMPPWWGAGQLAEAIQENLVLTPQSGRTAPIAWLVHWCFAAPVTTNGLMAAAMAAVALLLWFRPDSRLTLGLAVTWFLIVWWLGENFGGLAGGVATDPNSGPLWILLAVSAWMPASRAVPEPAVSPPVSPSAA
jgi:hypothetical protein